MITKTTGYKASDGQVYATVEEAQAQELASALNAAAIASNFEHWSDSETENHENDGLTMAKWLLDHQADNIIAILTTGPRSRPRARKASGTTNPRRAVKRATPEQVKEGVAEMRAAADGKETTI